jgi:hypothetical protein
MHEAKALLLLVSFEQEENGFNCLKVNQGGRAWGMQWWNNGYDLMEGVKTCGEIRELFGGYHLFVTLNYCCVKCGKKCMVQVKGSINY